MEAILVPVEQHTSDAVFHAALAVARTFDSYIEGIALGPSVPDVTIGDVGQLPALDPDSMQVPTHAARSNIHAGSPCHWAPSAPLNVQRK